MAKESPMTASQVASLLKTDAILLNVKATDKVSALREIVALLATNASIVSVEAFFAELMAREGEGTTALGHGVAIPHARTDQCREIVMAVGRSVKGIDCGAPDGAPVKLIFLIGTPKHLVTEYLRVVGGLARVISRDDVRRRLLSAPDAGSFIAAIAEAGG